MQGTPESSFGLRWQAWLVGAGFALLPLGFVLERAWQSLPRAHAAELVAVALIASAFAATCRKMWRLPWADGLLAAFTLALLAFAGPLPLAAISLIAAAATGLGAAIGGTRAGFVVAATVGVGALTGTLGWLLPFPIHFRLVYLAALLGIAFATRAHLYAALRAARENWRAAVDAEPAVAAGAVLAAGLASVGCWLPTVQFDDLAYHLGLPSQLLAFGYYRLDAHSQIWALAPWSGDILQGVAEVLAGGEARSAVDAFWLLALLALAWQLAAALNLDVRGRWLCMALIASQPLTAALAGGMQAELPATTTAFALALCVARAGERADVRTGLAAALLVGLLLALKTGFIALALPLVLVLLWRWRRTLSLSGVALALLLLAFAAGSCYAYAEFLTGNPVFPILNGVFRSPLMEPENLADPRWNAPVGWDLPWRLVFRTHDYAESWNGTAGFSLLALAGALLPALAAARTRWLTLCAALAFAAAISTVHYFRYAYPALMLLTPCLVAAVLDVFSVRSATRLLFGLVALNLLYQGAGFWTLHSGALLREVAGLSVDPVYLRFAPERLLSAWVQAHDPDARVVYCAWERPFAAELAGRGFTISHYDPELERLHRDAEEDATGAAWRAIFRRTGATYAAVLDEATSPALRAALGDATAVLHANGSTLWRLAPMPADGDLLRRRDAAVLDFRP